MFLISRPALDRAVSSYPFYPFQVWSMKCVSKKSTSSTWESWLFNKLFSAFSKSLWPQRTVWDGGKSTASSKPCDVQTSIDCNFQEKWFGRIFGGDWIKVVSFPFQPFQPTLSSQRPHNFTLLLEAERGNCREVWFHLWWHLLGSVHWNGRSLLQRFYRSTWLGFCQWADCRIGIGKKRMFFCLKRANFPSSLFFVLVSCLNSWKFQLTWLDFFECKDTLKKTSQSKGPPSHKTKNRLRHSYGILKHRPCPSVSAENFLGNFSGVVTGKPAFPPHFKGEFSMEPKRGSHEMFEFIQNKSWLGFTFKAGGYRSETWPTCEETASLGVCKIQHVGHPNSLATCELDTFHL